MITDTLLIELLGRVAANNGESIFVSSKELSNWPVDFVTAIKSSDLITQAPPAKSTVCPGCEQLCSMPLNVIINESGISSIFIVCDKRDDINRVLVPACSVAQWHASGYSLANAISRLLDLPLSKMNVAEKARWEIGVFRGTKHASHIVLIAESTLLLSMAGHHLPINEIISIKNAALTIDRRKICLAVDNPAAGGGDTESALERKTRLQNRVNELRFRGIKGFLKRTAEEENISVPRLKQILSNKAKSPRQNSDW